jgi:carboxypeptidase C (cathepsin A)
MSIPRISFLNKNVHQMGFLENLVKVFPGLRERPLILTGESYAGVYIVSFFCLLVSSNCCPDIRIKSTAVHHEDLF